MPGDRKGLVASNVIDNGHRTPHAVPVILWIAVFGQSFLSWGNPLSVAGFFNWGIRWGSVSSRQPNCIDSGNGQVRLRRNIARNTEHTWDNQ